MSDLNLNFDTGSKSVVINSVSEANGSAGGGITTSNHDTTSSGPTATSNIVPNLSVAAPTGMEFLAKGSPNNSAENTPRSTGNESAGKASDKSEEFTFFKPSEDKGGIVDGGFPNAPADPSTTEMLINPNNQEAQSEPAKSEFQPIHRLSPQDIKNEKIDLLYKFKKLEGQGIRTTMNYNMNSHLEDMRNEYIKLKKQREVDNSVKFQRKMLMACVTGLEFLNNRFDPFSVKLDGWSESVNENLNDYDEIFEELNEKYGGDSEMAPEIRLMFTLAGSAFMFHLSNTMFKSSIPGMDDVLQQNPELMKQFAEAAVGSMNKPQGPQQPQMRPQQQAPPPGQRMPEPPNPLAAMMGLGGGGGGNPLSGLMGMMGGGGPPRAPQQQQGPQQQGPQGAQANARPASPARSDMSGPDGIDDLINKMNLQPDKIPDLDNISLMSGDTDKRGGITLNL